MVCWVAAMADLNTQRWSLAEGVRTHDEVRAGASNTGAEMVISASDTSSSALRTAILTLCSPTRDGHTASTVQRPGRGLIHCVSATGPSNVLTMAPTEIADAGRSSM